LVRRYGPPGIGYLLALARAHGGQLAAFDRHLVADALIGGAQALHRIA
jgi:hypothetical protein